MGGRLLGPGRHPHHRFPRRAQPRVNADIRYACGWNPACRRRISRYAPASARAATRPGCWCRSCASWDWPPGSSPATWCSSPRRRGARRAVGARPPTSPTCTRGPRCTSRVRAGSGWTRRRGFSPARATSRWQPPRTRRQRHRSAAHRALRVVLEFSNTVTRVHEDPRVTLPYTDKAWQTICALGQRVDEQLAAADVRLTVGGEPTFVSVDNQVDEEWTTAADGPHKRERASDLAARLKAVWAPQGLIHRGQGRWYPGRAVAALADCAVLAHRRAPLWADDALLADPWRREANPPTPRECRRGPPGARRSRRRTRAAALAGAAGVRGSAVAAGGQRPDARRRPGGIQRRPRPRNRQRHRRGPRRAAGRLDESTTSPAAFVLPLHRRDDDLGWASADWRLRRGRIVLIEGDSPAGLRLPLDSISWQPPRASLTSTR